VSGPRLRVATASDAAVIAALHAASWRTTYRGALSDAYLDGDVLSERRTVWRERLETPAANQWVVVAEAAGEVVGFACAYGAKDERFGTELDNLHVRSDRQSGGIGAHLLRAVAEWCAATHPDVGLYLWVLTRNGRARDFYARLGADDAGADVWLPPDGSPVPVRRCVWPVAALAVLAGRAS
jgi:GNAT superfamily N-acetyltransferase